jgi:hypothetical protein
MVRAWTFSKAQTTKEALNSAGWAWLWTHMFGAGSLGALPLKN